MKIPLSWLKEFIDLNLPPHQIAKMLTAAGIEVEGLITPKIGFEKVIVGRVLETERHPNADKLCVAKVTDGVETYQVVCGAPNCRSGIKTAFAQVGATLTDEKGEVFKVKKATLRGVESFGMLCSEKELGIGGEHSGIMEFADQIKEGADVAGIYSDTLFEISLTPNLNYCASVFGIARELATITGLPIKRLPIKPEERLDRPISSEVKVTIENTEACPRYGCRVIHDVKVGPSPEWLKKRLEDCGVRPVNNVVDATNLLMLEMGHPLHAFDFDKVEGKEIVVRSAKTGETLITLDGKERKLVESDLLIADQAKPIALAGVMGGANSEVGMGTRHILLEAAYFNPRTIRKMSKRLGLLTDSSKRFERGCDPNALHEALDRAATLIQQIAGGTVAASVLDIQARPFPEIKLTCRLERINSILGTHLSVSEVEDIFRRLHFSCSWNGQDAFVLHIPSYRVDIREEIDLVEEVARTYGYDNIPKSLPRYQSSAIPHAPIYLFEKEIRNRLVATGLQEFLTCDLIGPTILNIVGGSLMPPEATVKVLNPTSIEQSILRTSLLPGLLQLIKFNVDHQRPDISGFEVGRIHFKKGEQFLEQLVAGIILTGGRTPSHWDVKPSNCDFYDLKGIVENLLQELGIDGVTFHPTSLPIFHPGRRTSVHVGELELGSFGEVHPAILRRLDVAQEIYFAEFNLHDLIKVRKREWRMAEMPLYPGSERDWTATLPNQIAVEQLLQFFHQYPSKLLQKAVVVDLYRSEKLGADKKNVTFRFLYRAQERTVEQEEVEKEHNALVLLAIQQFQL